MWFRTGAFHVPPVASDGTSRKIPSPTPVVFPSFAPQAEESPLATSSPERTPLVALLQTIQRPTDIQLSHFEALGLHVIPDASPEDILPDASYLPPIDKWTCTPPEDLEAATIASKKPLNNGNLSPGLQTYLERRNELSIDNTAAFRTIRRIPLPTGETAVRLGNAYEFFKNLELFSGYWVDTSLPPKPEATEEEKEKEAKNPTPPHLQTHQRTGNGAQLPPEYRQHLLTAFIKLVAYDFGCNVSFSRVEPRLHLTPLPTSNFPSSYFNSSTQFIYRTPRDRASARTGVVEGPLAAVSCRTTTVFATETDERLDLAREVIAVLLTAQQRAREGKEETRFGEGKWWTTVPRWGGGPGGAIGRESDKTPPTDESISAKMTLGEKLDPAVAAATTVMSNAAGQMMKVPEQLGISDVKRAIGGINPSVSGPSPSKKSKRGGTKEGNMAIYENYRKMLPPSSNWDRKTRYEAIGKIKGAGYDDIFLVSALNHHVSIVRVRVPERLLKVLGGDVVDENGREWGRVMAWRSRWFDLFLISDRIEGIGLIWGMMAWLMRAVDEPSASASDENKRPVDEGDKMDTS
jgi:hypothetical protein